MLPIPAMLPMSPMPLMLLMLPMLPMPLMPLMPLMSPMSPMSPMLAEPPVPSGPIIIMLVADGWSSCDAPLAPASKPLW